MMRGSTFEVSPESIRIDVRVAWEFATCCGVNLAVFVVVFGFFPARCEAVAFQNSGITLDTVRFQNGARQYFWK
jgi:hypothetical protein